MAWLHNFFCFNFEAGFQQKSSRRPINPWNQNRYLTLHSTWVDSCFVKSIIGTCFRLNCSTAWVLQSFCLKQEPYVAFYEQVWLPHPEHCRQRPIFWHLESPQKQCCSQTDIINNTTATKNSSASVTPTITKFKNNYIKNHEKNNEINNYIIHFNKQSSNSSVITKSGSSCQGAYVEIPR